MSADQAIYSSIDHGALRQGEILREVVQYSPISLAGPEGVQVNAISHPFCVILSQECDLEWDFSARKEGGNVTKKLPNVLLCSADDVQYVRKPQGEMNSSIFGKVKNNKDERYQFLEAYSRTVDGLEVEFPPLVLDFKQYFTVPTEILYEQFGTSRGRLGLATPYAEHLSTRFAYFLSRVALPREHRIPD